MSKLLVPGASYLLFVKPFHLGPDDETGRYIITGDQRTYRRDAAPGSCTFTGSGEPALPEAMTGADVRRRTSCAAGALLSGIPISLRVPLGRNESDPPSRTGRQTRYRLMARIW